MPRRSAGRTVDVETNLAQRVRLEREWRGWSYERLAEQMKAAGCPTHSASMFRIEQGDPPRRITVDELMAFSRVFQTGVEDLLTPFELWRKEKAKGVAKGISESEAQLATGVIEASSAWRQWHELASKDSELREFASSHMGEAWEAEKARVLAGVSDGGAVSETSRWQLERALIDLRIAIIDAADGEENRELLADPARDATALRQLMLHMSRRLLAQREERGAGS